MDRRRKDKQPRRTTGYAAAATTNTAPCCSDEASSIEWEFISMSEQEEDLIYRMYLLVGDRARPRSNPQSLCEMLAMQWDVVKSFRYSRWGLIAGRIPGRKAEEIERFWIMRHGDVYAERRRQHQRQQMRRAR